MLTHESTSNIRQGSNVYQSGGPI